MTEKKSNVKRIFDSIAFRYDLLNHLLSFGLDFYWRKKALKLTGMNLDTVLLDVACGTGDFAIAAKKMGVENIFGVDYSKNMLELFTKKSVWITGRTVQTVAETMPIKSNIVTNITVAFGVRNFYNIVEGFKSFHEILIPGGKATILEFKLPSNIFLNALYKYYFKKILPKVGGLISGDKEAYEYLPSSVEEFDEKVNLPQLLKAAGFESVEQHSLTFGTVQIIIATK
jgi:demethylmenaquinone methyltransferase/2-methoxy-6-polyprenyl-1,4-benzoquinol methylase